MKISEALRLSRPVDLPSFSLHRYGYTGSLADTANVLAWLADHPLLDIDLPSSGDLLGSARKERPQQIAFRNLVGSAYDWVCALSGCNVPDALEAAHLGPWETCNAASDGILLRVDLHRLFDRGHLTFIRAGRHLSAHIKSAYYSDFDGRELRMPRQRADWPRLR